MNSSQCENKTTVSLTPPVWIQGHLLRSWQLASTLSFSNGFFIPLGSRTSPVHGRYLTQHEPKAFHLLLQLTIQTPSQATCRQTKCPQTPHNLQTLRQGTPPFYWTWACKDSHRIRQPSCFLRQKLAGEERQSIEGTTGKLGPKDFEAGGQTSQDVFLDFLVRYKPTDFHRHISRMFSDFLHCKDNC